MALILASIVIAIIVIVMMYPVLLEINCYCQDPQPWQKGCKSLPSTDPRCQKLDKFLVQIKHVQDQVVKFHSVLPNSLIPDLSVKKQIKMFEDLLNNPPKPSESLQFFANTTIDLADTVLGEACKFHPVKYIQKLLEEMCCVIVSGGPCTIKNKEICRQVIQMYIDLINRGVAWAVAHFKKIVEQIDQVIPDYVKDIVMGVVNGAIWMQQQFVTWAEKGIEWAIETLNKVAEAGKSWARDLLCQNLGAQWAYNIVQKSGVLRMALCKFRLGGDCVEAVDELAAFYYDTAAKFVSGCRKLSASGCKYNIKQIIRRNCKKYGVDHMFWRKDIWGGIVGKDRCFDCQSGAVNSGFRTTLTEYMLTTDILNKLTGLLQVIIHGLVIVDCKDSRGPCRPRHGT